MKMSGEETIAAPIENVWAALNDPDLLKQCIPGCESITKKSDTEFSARVVLKIGPIKAGFGGNVELKDLNPPHSYRIEGKGEGGLAGFATGGATVRLETVPEGTKMSYDVDAQVGGKMAMLGSRLIDGTAQSLAGQFFEKFAKLAAEKKVVTGKAEAVKAKKSVVMKKKMPIVRKELAKKKTVLKKAGKKVVKKK
jgi:uncharacterized protein